MKKKNRDHIPPGVESGSAMELNTKKIDSQSTSDTSHAPDMDSPIIPEHQIRSKNCIKSSVSAPQLDDINVSVTKTFHSIQNYGETENHSEAENHREELFSVLISYGASERHIKTLVPCPRDQRKNKPPKSTWTRLLRNPTNACMDIFVGQKTVGAKQHYDSNEHGDRIQNRVASKRNKTVEDSLQTTAPTTEDDAQPR